MRILITGANGFIGSYLAHYFLRDGHNVIACSRQFHESTKFLLKSAEIIAIDILNNEHLLHMTAEADMLIHTATANDIISKNTLKGIELSVIGTKNILDFAIRNNIPKCIVFSTLQVYGSELAGSINENSPVANENDYGLNHLYAEMYAEMYSRLGKIQCVSVRPSNVFGPILTDSFNRWSLVPGCFCKEAFETDTITIKSSGKQMRNFVHLENLSAAIENITENFPSQYTNYNLASSQGNTMVEVAGMVQQIYENEFHRSLHINVAGTVPSETNHFSISLEKLQNIGFKEDKTFSLHSAIKQIFEYLKSKKLYGTN